MRFKKQDIFAMQMKHTIHVAFELCRSNLAYCALKYETTQYIGPFNPSLRKLFDISTNYCFRVNYGNLLTLVHWVKTVQLQTHIKFQFQLIINAKKLQD